MTWIKLEEKAPRHPKISGLSHPAFRVWVTSLCYASEFLTDGILPPVYLMTVRTSIKDELVIAGLWDVDGDTTRIHDYLGHQSDRASIDHKKAINRERQSRHRNALRNAPSNALVTQPDTENREQIPENREQTTAPPSLPPRPIISGESNPKNWGKIHGDHVVGFCDWVCLPEFIFSEFMRKTPRGHAYVMGWAKQIRAIWESKDIGDNLKFWRARWSESHPEAAESKPKIRPVAEILAERERKSS